MRTLFLALATSAAIFATGVPPVAANEYRYCVQGDHYAGAGDCGLASYHNVRPSHRAARPAAGPILISRTPPSWQLLPGSVVADAARVTSK
jgi:hypothetical protein